MNPRAFLCLATSAAVMLCTGTVLAEEAPASGSEIKVMSYNLRFGTARDGENHWDKRKDFLTDVVKAANPDLLGTQETLSMQRDFLMANLPGYEVLAASRTNGAEEGEMTAIFWRRDRFEKQAGGHFWLSEKPDEVGSKGWDTSLPRMATWVRLKEKGREARPILWLNTHFDHRGSEARVESSKLLRTKLAELGEGCSLVVTGDFNAGEGSAPYTALFGGESPLVDSFRVAHPERREDEGTFTPFLSAPVKDDRIDWIGISRDWKLQSATIEHPDRAGRTASDHFPVISVLRR
jgi:endonuclease/exonuclease/phosphatase family metal-dependent hydrolase